MPTQRYIYTTSLSLAYFHIIFISCIHTCTQFYTHEILCHIFNFTFSSPKSLIGTSKTDRGEHVGIQAEHNNTLEHQQPIHFTTDLVVSDKYSPSVYLNLLFELPPTSTAASRSLQIYAILISNYMYNSYILNTLPNRPTKLYCEKDLETAFSTISNLLSKVDDWESRMKALGQLEGLALGDGMEYETFPSALRGIHDLLIAQISDLRSTLCKEACRTTAVLARRMAGAFSIMAELLVPSLMKQACVKTQIMATAADRCLRTIVSSCSNGYPKILPLFFDCISNKNAMPATRRIAAEYICLASALWPLEILEKSMNQLKHAIRTGVADADKDVRRAARQLFWVLHGRSGLTQGLDHLLERLESSTQKHIHQEKVAPNNDLLCLLSRPIPPPDSVMPEHSISLAAELVPTKRPGNFESSKLRQSVNDPVATVVPKAALSSTAVRPKPITVSTSTTRDREKDITTGPLQRPTKSISASVDADIVVALADKASTKASNVAIGAPGRKPTMASGPVRISSQKTAQDPSVPTASQPILTPSGTSGQLQTAISRKLIEPVADLPVSVFPFAEYNAVLSAPAVSATAASTNCAPLKSMSTTSSAAGLYLQGPKRIARQIPQPPASIMVQTIGPTLGTDTVTKSYFVTKSPEKPKEPLAVLPLDELRALSEDSHWENRVQAMEMLNNRLQGLVVTATEVDLHDKSFTPLQISTIEVLLEILVNRLDDAHHKVTIESLIALELCVENFTVLSVSKLPLFLPALFQRLVDRRPHIKEKANSLLNIVRTIYEPVVLVAALAPRVADVPANIKAAVLQFLIVIVPYASQYFSEKNNLGVFLGRLANILGSTGGPKPSIALLSSGSRLVELVYKCAPQSMFAQVALMPLQQQAAIRKLLESTVPDFDYLLLTVSNGKVEASNNSNKGKSNKALKNLSSVVPMVNHSQSSLESQIAIISPEIAIPLSHADISPSYSSGHNLPKTNSPIMVKGSNCSPCTTESSISVKTLPNFCPTQTKQPLLSSVNVFVAEERTRDLIWILCSLHPKQGNTAEKVEAIKELKKLAKSGSNDFWQDNSAQIVSVLLESFHVELFVNNEYNEDRNLFLTGLTPQHSKYSQQNTPGSSSSNSENKENTKSRTNTADNNHSIVAESMHISCKALLIIVKYRAAYIKNLMDLVVTRLCAAASFAPVAISLHCEQILAEMAILDAPKLVRLVTRFISDNNIIPDDVHQMMLSSTSAHVQLLCLNVLSSALKHMSSSALLLEMPILLPLILPAFHSELVDVRKAVVFVLVEMYLVVGDALHPHVSILSPPQRKLLTIYIDRQMSQRAVV